MLKYSYTKPLNITTVLFILYAMETTKKHDIELKSDHKQQQHSQNFLANFLRHPVDSIKKTPEEKYSKEKLNKKLNRIDKIFNFIEVSTMLSPVLSLIAVTLLHKLSDISDTVFIDSYISNVVSLLLLPLSLTGVKKTREKFKNRTIKKYTNKNNT